MGKTSNTKRLCEGDRCFIEFSYCFPELPDGAAGVRMEKTLVMLKDAALSRAEAALPALAARYAESTDPHKAMRHRPLELSLDFFAEEKKHCYHISLRLSLCRCGRTLAQRKEAARFDKQSGRLLFRRKRNSDL